MIPRSVRQYAQCRRENLIALAEKCGSLERLSDAVGVSASYLSQMKKTRNMGDKIARRFEQRLGLGRGAMDRQLHSADLSQAEAGNVAGLEMPVEQLARELRDLPRGLRGYMVRKLAQLGSYVQRERPFIVNNLRPPSDPDSFAAWEEDFNRELARVATDKNEAQNV